MFHKSVWIAIAAAAWITSAWAGTFGTAVSIGGEASDLAIDEPRGVLYIADFTASRVDVMSLTTRQIQGSIAVAPNPGSMSLSPDGRWLLISHFDNTTPPALSTFNQLTVIDLKNQNARRILKLNDPPLGVGFGFDNLAFVVTTKEYLLYDPNANQTSVIDTVAGVAAKTIPVPLDSFPLDITSGSVSASADRKTLFGIASSTGTITFRYDAGSHTVSPGEIVLSSGVLGPRVASVSNDGSRVMAGWITLVRGVGISNFIPYHSDQFSVGTSAIDDLRGLIYAQIPAKAGEDPTLQILAADNLTLVERLKLPENTTGKSILDSSASVLYSVSDSGVLVLPVGSLNAAKRVATSVPSLLFRGNFCDNSKLSRTLEIRNPGGVKTAFTLTASNPGVTVSPASGTTPATVTVTVDPSAFSAVHGTTPVTLTVASSDAVNVIPPVRVLVNHAEPSQRGSIVEVPGTLVDVLADPIHDRYFVLRQDNNTVLVFDASNNTQIWSMRTNNIPTSMALTFDRRFLLVGHMASETLAVYDADSLFRFGDVSTSAGNGDIVRSLAASSNAIVATAEDYKGTGHVILFDQFFNVTQPAALSVWKNEINLDAVATASADGSKVMVAASDGNVLLYDASVGDFTVSRQDFSGLAGSYAATPGIFTVGNHLLDASLVPIADMDSSGGAASGFVFAGGGAVRTGAMDPASPGFIERVDLASGAAITPIPSVEAPPLTTALSQSSPSKFTRSLASLVFRSGFVSLSTSGVTVFPGNYDAPVPQPVISKVVSAADLSSGVASGGLISVLGSNLSAAPIAASDRPLPTILGNSCLTVNGQPISLLLVSPSQINAQLAYSSTGAATMVARTTSAKSADFNFKIASTAPAVFLNGQAGSSTTLPAIVRAENGLLVTSSNPVRHGDTLTIFAAGLGVTAPPVNAGATSPDPPATAVTHASVQLGGVGLPLYQADLVPGQVGVFEITVAVPNWTPLGLSVPLTITQGGLSQTINVRVVN